MISFKTITTVVILAILIGVLYVLFEKNFNNTSLGQTKIFSSNQKTPTTTQTPEKVSVIKYPDPTPTPAAIDGSTDLSAEAESLQMRDYSGMFEELKDKVQE